MWDKHTFVGALYVTCPFDRMEWRVCHDMWTTKNLYIIHPRKHQSYLIRLYQNNVNRGLVYVVVLLEPTQPALNIRHARLKLTSHAQVICIGENCMIYCISVVISFRFKSAKVSFPNNVKPTVTCKIIISNFRISTQ